MKEIIAAVIIYFVILIAITFTWQVLEIIELGTIQPSTSDSIISVILAYLLYEKVKRN